MDICFFPRRILQTGIDEDHYFIVMFYGGVNLQCLFQRRPVKDIYMLRRITQHLFEGLAFLHSKRIIHRDIKPDNLFLDQYNVLRIGDFGLSKLVSFPNRAMTLEVFAEAFRAPELMEGNSLYTYNVDVWAAACVCMFMLTGSYVLPLTPFEKLGNNKKDRARCLLKDIQMFLQENRLATTVYRYVPPHCYDVTLNLLKVCGGKRK
jgi:serine/threonine protein kinase